jgi:hypothetical protein
MSYNPHSWVLEFLNGEQSHRNSQWNGTFINGYPKHKKYKNAKNLKPPHPYFV